MTFLSSCFCCVSLSVDSAFTLFCQVLGDRLTGVNPLSCCIREPGEMGEWAWVGWEQV